MLVIKCCGGINNIATFVKIKVHLFFIPFVFCKYCENPHKDKCVGGVHDKQIIAA